MSEDTKPSGAELEFLRTAVHDLNNRVGVILATSELLQMDIPEGKARTRCELVEQKAMEAREILLQISHRYFD